ncbi:catechol-2,3-dioxygenase [Herbaspirillum sp. Sphag1AN]|uniref:VOC family protein n=1 Tax=unclassified Herbaspirillum TaxID=2624150 RepID=UPI00161098C5|nr:MULTISPECIES: VOC family protein [unclassified Herbaspirillum]MBB3213060.1 catechol-2,3-dioxygenase [Herbaspirillum sp. Sphag1AN]MBB3246257.1 catechol-2,3-dioxygenase [Herbaspirillum sp. Sphag64]
MTSMQIDHPAQLYYLHISSENPERLAAFYREQMSLDEKVIAGQHVLRGGSRAVIVSKGSSGELLFPAYALQSAEALARLRTRLNVKGISMTPLSTPLYAEGAFTIEDPQGRKTAYGICANHRVSDPEPARLQHVVFQTTELEAVVRFYVDKIGFSISDEVIDEETGQLAVAFLRSDDEHHSLAFFRGSRNEWDHHCYETNEWNDIRDWGDKFAKQHMQIFFGPGRHGPGNNLFFMVTDPDGNRLEISAEIERIAADASPGVWPHNEYTLNSWGRAWMRT